MSTHAASGYARPGLLAEPDWLWDHRDDPAIRLVDCTAVEAYERAHIPTALHLPVHPWLKAEIKDHRDAMYVIGPREFEEAMAQLGVTADTTIVAYDSFNSLLSGRLWWVLRYYGHTRARVLNGGWHRWLAEGRPLSAEPGRVERRGDLKARSDESVICRVDDLMARLGSPGVQVVSALPREIYEGSNYYRNDRNGRIPGSVNVPAQSVVTSDASRAIKGAPEIERILGDAGVSRDQEVIVHCQGGMRSAFLTYVLALIGYERVRLYDASMGEWANRTDTPMEVPAAQPVSA